jgi:hypothetical protein
MPDKNVAKEPQIRFITPHRRIAVGRIGSSPAAGEFNNISPKKNLGFSRSVSVEGTSFLI